MSAPPQTRGWLDMQPRGPEYLCTAILHEQCPHMPRISRGSSGWAKRPRSKLLGAAIDRLARSTVSPALP